MRGRKPKPTEQKIAEGVRASRINLNAPDFASDNSPEPPVHLGRFAAEEWRRIYPELSKKNVLKVTDRVTLELYCEAYEDYRIAKEFLDKQTRKAAETNNGNIQQLPEVSMKRAAMTLLLKYATELGITPSSRGRINSGAAASTSKLKDFMAGGLKDGQKGS